MELNCAILGGRGSTFFATVDSPKDTIGDLKNVIQTTVDLHVPAYQLQLFLPSKDGAWLTRSEAKRVTKTNFHFSLDDAWLGNPLGSCKVVENVFKSEMGEDVINVLVKLPELDEAMMILATVRLERVLSQMRKRANEVEMHAAYEMENKRLLDEHIASIPPQRKRDWDVLNEALEPKVKDGKAEFSSMEYESLPKRFRTDGGSVTHGPFYDLMTNAQGINDNSLDDLMNDLDFKKGAYEDPSFNDATRGIFMSAVLEHVVYMFRNAGKEFDRVTLDIQSELTGTFVKATGDVDYMIRRGKKAVCVAMAKNLDFDMGTVQIVLGMEVAAEMNNVEHIYGVVTDNVEWRFLKRTDDGIERFDDLNDLSRERVGRIAGRLYAIMNAN